MDKTILLERAQQQLATREKALKDTLAHLAWLEQAIKDLPAQHTPGLQAAIESARTKRDRQHNACTASQAIIDAINTTTKTNPKTK